MVFNTRGGAPPRRWTPCLAGPAARHGGGNGGGGGCVRRLQWGALRPGRRAAAPSLEGGGWPDGAGAAHKGWG
jgi:hypothetical protein